METEFVPYDIAVVLKELGFNEDCFAQYVEVDKNKFKLLTIDEVDMLDMEYGLGRNLITNAPLYQQAFRWFREEHNLNSIPIKPHWERENKRFIYRYSFFEPNEYRIDEFEQWDSTDWWLTPKETQLACLRKLIEIVKNDKE